MSTVLRIAFFGLVIFTSAAAFAISPDAALSTARVAVLPFSNYAEEPAAMPMVMEAVRGELGRRSVELVTSDAIAEVLRKYRVRNTNEISVEQLRELSRDLAADYILIGALDRYVTADEGAEIALTARLLDAATARIEWISTSAVHSSDGIRPLDLGPSKAAGKNLHRAVKSLFKDFRLERAGKSMLVQAVKLHDGKSSYSLPCQSLLVLPFNNETEIHHAGNIVSQRVLAALFHEGFTLADPGRVREAMLQDGDLTPGKATDSLLTICREQVSTDLVLTGTVSRISVGTGVSVDAVPEVSIEARLINARTTDVVWAKTFSASGDDGKLLFGTGMTHGVGSVIDQLAAKLADSIPVRKARKA